VRIDARLPHALAGLEAHPVRGGEVRSFPGDGDPVAMHEREHRAAGLGESAFIAHPAHGLENGERGIMRRRC